MTRLLLITIDYPPKRGGVARYLQEMAEYFGEQMTVVTDGLLFENFWPQWLRAFGSLFRRRNSYDVLIVSHVLPLGLVALINRRLWHKPYVVILHGMDFALARRNGWKQNLTRRILAEADLVVTNTESLAREVLGFVRPKALQTVYPSLSEGFIAAAESFQRDQSIALQAAHPPTHFLTVARLVARKGHAHVLDALAQLKSEHRLGPFDYTIVGSGPLASELKGHTRVLGLENEVHFVEQADDAQLISEYQAADVFVMPTEHLGKDIEGFGTVYIEAAAFGLPSIASDLQGVDEAVIDKQTGLLIPSSSVADLCEALERLAADPILRWRLGLAGRERAISQFTADKQFSKLNFRPISV